MKSFLPGLLAASLFAGAAQAQVIFTELLINPPGTDDTEEAVELQGPAGFALTGWRLLAIEGDGTGAGVVDQSIDLSAYTIGNNGLLLIRSANSVILPGPDAGTAVQVFNFTPDLENGSNTYVLGFGTAPAVNADLDSDNDGTLNVGALAGFTVVDAVSIVENDGASNFAYADDLGFAQAVLGPYNGPLPAAHTPDFAYRVLDADGKGLSWAGGDVLGTNPGGPYSFDSAFGEIVGLLEADVDPLGGLSLGQPNLTRAFASVLTQSALSAASGGIQNLTLAAGAAQAGKFFLLLGSFSGTTPGLPLGAVTLPLNADAYTNFVLANGSLVFAPASGFLGLDGRATTTLTIPALPSVVGPVTAHHAFLALSVFPAITIDFASNPVALVLQ